MTHTLNDCGCIAKVYSDGSGVDIEFCEMHLNAPARAEAAEARAAQAETERDAAWLELREIRRLIEAEKDEATIDEVTRKVYRLSKDAHDAEQQLDEARRQLAEAQHVIDVLSNTVVAQNNEIKRLSQQREDVEQYRAEIARLNQAATA